MTAYADPLRHTFPSRPRWPYKAACHLYADTVEELHQLAATLGLSPDWFRPREDFPHYDLTAAKRRQAVEAGAVEVTRDHAVRFARVRRLANRREAHRDRRHPGP